MTGTIDSPVVIDEVTVIPAGSKLRGYVTSAQESGKVKGRAELGFRFTSLTVGPVTYDIATKPISCRAESNKKDDAVKIGVGAAAGAIVGAITGGKRARRLAPPSAQAAAPAWCWPPMATRFVSPPDASSKFLLQTR